MSKEIKKILKNNSKKKSISIALFGEKLWNQIRTGIIIVILIGIFTGINFNFIFNPENGLLMLSKIFFSVIVAIFETMVFILLAILVYTFSIEVPILLNRRYLSLTKEEVAALNMSESEFYDFLMKVSGKYLKLDKTWYFVDGMYEDVSVMLNFYNEINNKKEGYIWYDCNEEFKNWLSNHQFLARNGRKIKKYE